MCPKTKIGLKPIQKSIGDPKMDKKEKGKYSDSNMKPDKTCHDKKQDMGTMAKDAKLPGQMYVPKRTHNESDFAGEER